MTAVIEMNQISKTFGKKKVLDKISFAVQNDEIFGLLGPSGAGKTTIIKILTGQLAPDTGTAALLGKESGQLSSTEYTRVGMVLDESGIYMRLSVADNLKIFAEIYGTDKSQIVPALKKVGLEEALKKPAQQLSKGMLQRLVLARAIMHQPDVLFLDEPTSGLDPMTARSIHQLIIEQQARGCTIFLTTHNMEEADELCGRIILLNAGHIVEEGAPEDLCLKYNKTQHIQIRLKNGKEAKLENTPASAGVIAEYFKENLIETIHSTEPDLEAVFIELTGRKLA